MSRLIAFCLLLVPALSHAAWLWDKDLKQCSQFPNGETVGDVFERMQANEHNCHMKASDASGTAFVIVCGREFWAVFPMKAACDAFRNAELHPDLKAKPGTAKEI